VKDPLQEKDPYEMLGISEGADKKEVETAFKRCIASGHSVKEATWARNILNNPVERSFYDLFRYDENFLSQLRPRLTVDMLLQKRKQIAESWSIIQKKLFPHIPSTHSLAVLWYWWSLYREEELLASVMQTPFNRKQVQSLSASSENPFYFKKDNKILVASNNIDELIWAIDRLKRENPDIVAYHLKQGHIQEWLANSLGEPELSTLLLDIEDPNKAYNKITEFVLNKLWTNTISNWVFLINFKDFWLKWIELKKFDHSFTLELCQKLENHFVNLFRSYRERYRNIGDLSNSQRCQNYEFLFYTENQTAKLIKEGQIKISSKDGNYFILCCGRIMLEQVGLLNFVQEEVERAIKSCVQNENLKKLPLYLSPYAMLNTLLENKKFDEVIQVINALSPKERKNKHVLYLLTVAYFEKGKQYFSLKEYDNAFNSWIKALKTGELREEIIRTIVFNCKNEFAILQKTDPSLAILIIKKGIELTKDIELKKILSAVLCEMGIDRILKAQKDLEKNPNNSAAKKEIQSGVSELREAVELDPFNSRAKEQLKAAEQILSEIDFISIYVLMNRGEWDKAIKQLETILSKDPKNEKAKELLEICNINLCWFCEDKKRQPNESLSVEVKMHREVYTPDRKTLMQVISIKIPRCARCKEVHDKIKKFAIICGLIGFAVFYFIFLDKADDLSSIFVMSALIGYISYKVGLQIGYIIFGTGVRAKSDWKDFPLIKRARSEGFSHRYFW
jgi:tetratricopeptide (TPR) repeat protein